MNTASRIESNGAPGKIQVSQATADMIIEDGKGHWLQKREDKVSFDLLGRPIPRIVYSPHT